MQKIRCTNPSCGKTLCEAYGEVKKICPKCKKTVHVVATTLGVIDLDKLPATDKLCASNNVVK